MAFIEERLPDLLAYGALAGPQFLTLVGDSPSGYEQRQERWALERGAWDLSYRHRTTEETQLLIAFFLCVAAGRANGFRFFDWQTGEQEIVEGAIGIGDGIETTFQLVKFYTEGGETYTRIITKPVENTTTVTLDDVPTSAWTINATTGIIVFTDPVPDTVVIRVSCQFDVPVRFTVDWLALECIKNDVYTWGNVGLIEIRDIV